MKNFGLLKGDGMKDDTEMGDLPLQDYVFEEEYNTELVQEAFRVALESLVATGMDVSGIEEYFLDKAQQNILDEFSTGLEVFNGLVGVLLRQETSLLHEAIVRLFTLRQRLEDIRNGSIIVGTCPTSITRVASEAALGVYKSKASHYEIPEIEIVAVVMRPTYKLQWFEERGMNTIEIETLVIAHFDKHYPLIKLEGEKGLIHFKAIELLVSGVGDPASRCSNSSGLSQYSRFFHGSIAPVLWRSYCYPRTRETRR
ncbi:hypothetical protein B0J17DRAFT_723261 [Rhizoctonia solani]|nr:hypothetical protein B0J17DRAFT_723261 [Rhizoctonia solani]